jgi:beta-glucosidase
MSTPADFPQDFLWGAATSAYQIEGSPLADGAGPSNWHVFAHTPGRTHEGQTGDVACDHYRRWREDVALMHELGLKAYRFSVAWGRVLPEGRGAINRAGLDFYARLVDALLAAGIAPNLTLYHWDLPEALAAKGGWLNADIAGWLADYAATLARTLGDRVALWATLNEPWVVMDAGYVHGTHAPGLADPALSPPVAHNLLRAHGAAIQALRAELGARSAGKLGIVLNLEPKVAATEAPSDIDAAARDDVYMNRWFLEGLTLGRYPHELREMFGADWPAFAPGDFALIQEPIDWLGINYYKRGVVRDDPSVPVPRASPVKVPGGSYTDMGWEVWPQSLIDVLLWVKSRVSLPLYITENGASYHEPGTSPPDGIEDTGRLEYLRSHLLAAREAIRRGVDLRGYFVWSLLDNYEWACGYGQRLGIVHVDYATQKRTPKASARFYREVIATNGGALER